MNKKRRHKLLFRVAASQATYLELNYTLFLLHGSGEDIGK